MLLWAISSVLQKNQLLHFCSITCCSNKEILSLYKLTIKSDIPPNVWQHSPECLASFPGIFGNIPQDVWRRFPECLKTFPGI